MTIASRSEPSRHLHRYLSSIIYLMRIIDGHMRTLTAALFLDIFQLLSGISGYGLSLGRSIGLLVSYAP